MLLKAKKYCKKIFQYFGYTNKKIISNAGLILIKDFIIKIGLVELFEQTLKDKRNQNQITYRISELLLYGILRILNGQSRIFHWENVSQSWFSAIFTKGQVPNSKTPIYFFKQNTELSNDLKRILFNLSVKDLKERIKTKKLRRITIDVDQTARAIHGKQERARKGYSSKDRNSKLFQIAIWSIRETKTLLKVELLSGDTHCAKDFRFRIKEVVENLKPLGLEIRFVIDSGYASTDLFEYLDSEGIEFLCALKQTKAIKKRGKTAKNKKLGKFKKQISTVFKERQLVTKNGYKFREVYVQNRITYDEFGQLYFENFESDEFTNVFATNMELSSKNIYEHYKTHAVIETIVEELKNDFKLGIAHSHNFYFNDSLAQLSGIAYNVKNMFICDVGLKTKEDGSIMKLSTLQRKFIQSLALLVNHCGRIYLRVEKSVFFTFGEIFQHFNYKIQCDT